VSQMHLQPPQGMPWPMAAASRGMAPAAAMAAHATPSATQDASSTLRALLNINISGPSQPTYQPQPQPQPQQQPQPQSQPSRPDASAALRMMLGVL